MKGRKRRHTVSRSRPKVRPLPDDEKAQILKTLRRGIQSSPVLTTLGFRVRALRGRFYVERVQPLSGEQPAAEVMARVTPIEGADEDLLLEAEKRKGSWYTVMAGTAAEVIEALAGDEKGTFHGLGALDKSLREAGDDEQRWQVEMLPGPRFVYSRTGEICTTPEALFHFFNIPIEVLIEPRQWDIYHRQPRIVEAGQDRTRVLVRFKAYSRWGPFSGTCLYARVDGKWAAYTVKPNQSKSIETAVAWLKKREWRAW